MKVRLDLVGNPGQKGTARWRRGGNGKLPKDLMKDVSIPQMGIKADRRLFGDHGWGDVGHRANWTC